MIPFSLQHVGNSEGFGSCESGTVWLKSKMKTKYVFLTSHSIAHLFLHMIWGHLLGGGRPLCAESAGGSAFLKVSYPRCSGVRRAVKGPANSVCVWSPWSQAGNMALHPLLQEGLLDSLCPWLALHIWESVFCVFPVEVSPNGRTSGGQEPVWAPCTQAWPGFSPNWVPHLSAFE